MYTVGVVFYASRKIPYSHAIWHMFGMAGSFCHYLAVLYDGGTVMFESNRFHPDKKTGRF
jgi:hypothetical protein